MSSIITGYLRHVNDSRGELTATFTKDLSNPSYQYDLYLLFPEKAKEMNSSEYAQRFAVYQNFANHHTKISISYKPPKKFTGSGIAKVEVISVKEYKKVKREESIIHDDKIERLSEELRHNVVLSLQARINASKMALELEKIEDEEKEYLCILLDCLPKHANYCREDLGGEKSYFFSINYRKDEIKKFEAASKDDLFFQVIQFANELKERRKNE